MSVTLFLHGFSCIVTPSVADAFGSICSPWMLGDANDAVVLAVVEGTAVPMPHLQLG